MQKNRVKEIVKKRYSDIAKNSSSGCACACSCQGKQTQTNQSKTIASQIGYSKDEIDSFSEANLGLGCGNPTAISNISEGETVLDLGSGAGFDCFLAAIKVGNSGLVIGVDMSKEMIQKAQGIAKKNSVKNVEFRLGDIEKLPIEDRSIDVVISNCVINLAPDKKGVFEEAYRVLRNGGRMFVSDIVLLAELPQEVRENEALIAGCVGGAILRDDYIQIAKSVGFQVEVVSEDRDISKTQYDGFPLESLRIKLTK